MYLRHGVDQAEPTLAPSTVNAHHTHLQGQCTVSSHVMTKLNLKIGFVGLYIRVWLKASLITLMTDCFVMNKNVNKNITFLTCTFNSIFPTDGHISFHVLII